MGTERTWLAENDILVLTGQALSPEGNMPEGRSARYRIIRYMGRGATSIAYLAAEEDNNDQEVILKELFPSCLSGQMERRKTLDGISFTVAPRTQIELWLEQVSMFKKSVAGQIEAQRGSESGNNRIALYQDKNGDGHYIVSSFDGGITLADFEDRLYMSEILEMGAQIAFGLAELHQKHLIHIDVKDKNVLIHQRTHALQRILDFNSLLLFTVHGDPFSPHPRLDEGYIRDNYGGYISSTPDHAPCELFGEDFVKNDIGPAADIYELGVTLYKCMTGSSNVDRFRRYSPEDFPFYSYHTLLPHLQQGLRPDSDQWIDLCGLLYEMLGTIQCSQNCPEFCCIQCPMAKLANGVICRCRNTLRIARSLREMSRRFQKDSFYKMLDQARDAVRNLADGIQHPIDSDLLLRYQIPGGEINSLYQYLTENREQHTVLCLGETGIGKSFSFFHCITTMLQNEEQGLLRLPIYVNLDEAYYGTRIDNTNMILSMTQSLLWGHGRSAELITDFISSLERSGEKSVELVLFLDGLNEQRDLTVRNKILQDISELKDKPGIRLVIGDWSEEPRLGVKSILHAMSVDSDVICRKVIDLGYTPEQAQAIAPVLRTPILFRLFALQDPAAWEDAESITETKIMEQYFTSTVVGNLSHCPSGSTKFSGEELGKELLDHVLAPLMYEVECRRTGLVFDISLLKIFLQPYGISVDEFLGSCGVLTKLDCSSELRIYHQSYQEFLWAWHAQHLVTERKRGLPLWLSGGTRLNHICRNTDSDNSMRHLFLLLGPKKLRSYFRSRLFRMDSKLVRLYWEVTSATHLPTPVLRMTTLGMLFIMFMAGAIVLHISALPHPDRIAKIMPTEEGKMVITLYDDGRTEKRGNLRREDVLINGDPDIPVYGVSNALVVDPTDRTGKYLYLIETEDQQGRPFSISLSHFGQVKNTKIHVDKNYGCYYYRLTLEQLIPDRNYTRYLLTIEPADGYEILSVDLSGYMEVVTGGACMDLVKQEQNPHCYEYLLTLPLSHPDSRIIPTTGYPTRYLEAKYGVLYGAQSLPTHDLTQMVPAGEAAALLRAGAIRVISEDNNVISSEDELLIFSNT